MLTRDIRRGRRCAHQARDRRHVHDRAAALLLHLLQLVLHAQPNASQVDGDHLVEIRLRHLRDRLPVALDAGVVECSIDAAVLRDRPLYQCLDIGGLRDVCLDEHSLAARLADELYRLVPFLLAPPRDDDLRAVLREQHRRIAPDARRPPCYDRHLALQVLRQGSSSGIQAAGLYPRRQKPAAAGRAAYQPYLANSLDRAAPSR